MIMMIDKAQVAQVSYTEQLGTRGRDRYLLDSLYVAAQLMLVLTGAPPLCGGYIFGK